MLGKLFKSNKTAPVIASLFINVDSFKSLVYIFLIENNLSGFSFN